MPYLQLRSGYDAAAQTDVVMVVKITLFKDMDIQRREQYQWMFDYLQRDVRFRDASTKNHAQTRGIMKLWVGEQPMNKGRTMEHMLRSRRVIKIFKRYILVKQSRCIE